MASIKDILAVASDPTNHREATARILLDQTLANRHAELKSELERRAAEFVDNILKPAAVQELAKQVTAVEDEIRAAEIEFRFRGIPYRDWMTLIAAHPPTAAQQKVSRNADHNPDTFEPAAIAASCVDPEMTPEDAAQIRELLPFDSYTLLWTTCLTVNRGDGGPKVSPLASLILRRNGASSPPATTTPSQDPSSSDES